MQSKQGALGLVTIAVCSLLCSRGEARVSGTITRLSTGSAASTQTAPAISGTNVVWTDTAQLGGGATNSDIFFLDVASGQPARNLTNTVTEQEYLEDIDGASVVYTHSGPGMPGDILVYDTTLGGATTVAASDNQVRYAQPSVRGRYVVYIRYIGVQPDVDGFDTALGSPLAPITNDPAAQLHPRVSGSVIVFEDYNSGNADIYGYDIRGGAPFPIATGPHAQITPDVDGNNVVWIESVAPGNDQIVAYDLTTRALRTLTTVASNKMQPRVSGNRVVWADDRAGNLDIYSYDLAANREDVVVDGTGDQMLSDVDGNRIVYTSNETGFEQIYLFTVSAPPPPPPPPNKMPRGCDPAFTDLVAGPVTVVKNGPHPGHGGGAYDSLPNKDYFMCVENGLADGSQRTSWVVAANDWHVVLTPADFKPNNAPPHYVVAPLNIHAGHHQWQAAIVGSKNATITVTIRVSKAAGHGGHGDDDDDDDDDHGHGDDDHDCHGDNHGHGPQHRDFVAASTPQVATTHHNDTRNVAVAPTRLLLRTTR